MKQPSAALKREWNAKLKASGFEDIETGEEHTGLLKTDKRIEDGRGEEYAASAEYYRKAGVFMHHHQFVSERERRVWELHADGMGMNQIAKTAHVWNTGVHEIINRLRRVMLKGESKPGKGSNRNENAFFGWLNREAKKLSDQDLIEMAPTLLELARPTRKNSSTRRLASST